jgi:hypothetical protein
MAAASLIVLRINAVKTSLPNTKTPSVFREAIIDEVLASCFLLALKGIPLIRIVK